MRSDPLSAPAGPGASRPQAFERTTSGILDVARSVLGELDLDVVLNRVLAAAQDLTEARYAALGVLNESRTELARFLTRGIDKQHHAAIGPLPRGRGVLGTLINHPAPLRLADVGTHPRSYGLPPEHPPMSTFLGVPILIEGIPYGNLYLTEKAGGAEFSQEDEHAVGVLADFAGVAIDHARKYTGTREQRDELERMVAAHEATTQISRAVGGETDLDVILELVAKRGRALVSARSLLIELTEGNELVIAAGAGEMPRELLGRRVPLTDTVASHVMRTGRSQRLEDELNRARFQDHGLGALGVPAEAGLAVPLVFRGRSHGVLVAIDRFEDGPAFSAEDQRLLEAFAVTAASAVATAQSIASERRRQRQAAAEAERHRWARELHDETLQSLSALRIGLSTAGRSGRSEVIGRAISDAVAQLEDAIADLRALITDLRPAALDELGVAAALEGLVERSHRHGIEVDLAVSLAYEAGLASTRLDHELEIAIYRLVQEALTNAAKHGDAKRAVVEVDETPSAVTLSVRDDGSGFDPDQETQGFGLLGMRERVELLGGDLDIDSAPGRGTLIAAKLPVQRQPETHAGAQQLAGS